MVPTPTTKGSSGVAINRPGRLAWHHFYFALAIFDLLTVSTSLYLSHHLNIVFNESVLANEIGVSRLEVYEALGSLASQVNAPGNDVFNSLDAPKERSKFTVQLALFNAALNESQETMSNLVGPIGKQLRDGLAVVDVKMMAMVVEAQQIFKYFEENRADLAGTRMATMDQRYADLLEALRSLKKIASDDLNAQFQNQAKHAESLQLLEFVIGVAVILMIIGVSYYGHRLSKSMKAAKVAQEHHICEQARLVALIDSAEHAIISKTLTGVVTSWNEASERLFGYSAQEMIGMPMTRLSPPDHVGEEAEC